MKKLLGKKHGPLIRLAKENTKHDFLQKPTTELMKAIRRAVSIGHNEFWRAVKGKSFLPMPPEYEQGELDFED